MHSRFPVKYKKPEKRFCQPKNRHTRSGTCECDIVNGPDAISTRDSGILAGRSMHCSSMEKSRKFLVPDVKIASWSRIYEKECVRAWWDFDHRISEHRICACV